MRVKYVVKLKFPGYTYTIVIAIFLGLILLYYHYVYKYEYIYSDPKNNLIKRKTQGNKTIKYMAIIFFIIVLLCAYFIPKLMERSLVSEYQGYNMMVDNLMKNNFSKEQAINKIHELYTSRLTSNAINNAGWNMSWAFLLR